MADTDKNIFEGIHFDLLNDYIEKGTPPDQMEDEVVDYLKHLEFIRQRLNRTDSPKNVINSLMSFYPDLNLKQAKSRFDDALKFFYLDEQDNKDAWRNMLFEIAMKAIQLSIRTVDTPETALKIVDAVKKASEIKGLHLPEKISIPKQLLDEKVEIHSLTPGDVGLPEANRHELSRQIDQLPLKEHEKLKLKQEAGAVPREIFDHEQTND